jgi:hypothetical protein
MNGIEGEVSGVLFSRALIKLFWSLIKKTLYGMVPFTQAVL